MWDSDDVADVTADAAIEEVVADAAIEEVVADSAIEEFVAEAAIEEVVADATDADATDADATDADATFSIIFYISKAVTMMLFCSLLEPWVLQKHYLVAYQPALFSWIFVQDFRRQGWGSRFFVYFCFIMLGVVGPIIRILSFCTQKMRQLRI